MLRKDNLAIRDEYGRQLIFKGVNHCIKTDSLNRLGYRKFKSLNKIIDEYDKTLDKYVEQGVNIIRLGFNWAVLEPKRNCFDESAFEFLKKHIELAQQHGIYILLDLHQDLFCSKFRFGDGAPKWAVEDYPRKRPIAIWAEGYFYFKDVQRAFNDFWRNKDNMQSDFSALWDKIIQEFKDFDNIIGYDFLNEPMITDHSNEVFCRLINGAVKEGLNENFCAESYFKNGRERRGFINMVFAFMHKVQKNGGIKKLLTSLDSYQAFENAVTGLEAYTEEFNRRYYQPFIDSMSEKIDDGRLSFFEHNYYSNLGIPFEIEVKDNYIYSPHAYDLFIDSHLYNNYSSNDRIKYIIDSIRKNQLKMNVPVVMGEWGGTAHNGHKWVEHIDYIYSLFEQNQWSSLYWNYKPDDEKFTCVINRPYPCAVCGDIIKYSSDSKSRHFILEYDCKQDTAPTVIFIPNKGYTEFENKIGKNIIEINY